MSGTGPAPDPTTPGTTAPSTPPDLTGTAAARAADLVRYLVRRSTVYVSLSEQQLLLGVQERQREAAQRRLALKLASARRWEARAASAERRARALRASVL